MTPKSKIEIHGWDNVKDFLMTLYHGYHYSVSDIACILNKSDTTILRMMKDNKIPVKKKSTIKNLWRRKIPKEFSVGDIITDKSTHAKIVGKMQQIHICSDSSLRIISAVTLEILDTKKLFSFIYKVENAR